MPVLKNVLLTLLRDEFYFGKLCWNGEVDVLDPSVDRLLSESEFWQIQKILGERGLSKPYRHEEVGYRMLIRCGECGNLLTPYFKEKETKSGTTRYYYLRCTHDGSHKECSQVQIGFKELDSQILDLLSSISISSAFFDWAVKWLKECNYKRSENQTNEIDRINAQLKDTQKKIDNLIEMGMLGVVTPQEVKVRKESLQNERYQLERDLKGLNVQTFDWLETAIKTFNFAKNARYYFEHGSMLDKSQILKALGANFYVIDKKLCLDLLKPYFILKENADIVCLENDGCELSSLVSVSANVDAVKSWWAICEDVRTVLVSSYA